MRWFLTDEAPELEAALRGAGEEVVSGPDDRARLAVHGPGFHPQEYPLAARALGARADVVVLVDPIRAISFPDGNAEFGYARGHGKTLRNRGVTLVMWAHDSEWTLRAFMGGRYRSCACETSDVAVHAVGTESAAELVRGLRRVARWVPGESAARIVEAVRHARDGKTYSPRREGRAWS